MEAYTSFAQVYDLFMDNVPYEKWCNFIHEILQKDGMDENIILDLACGTGKMTRMLADRGYDMIGVDNSIEMLEIARAQEPGYCVEIGDPEDYDPEECNPEECNPEDYDLKDCNLKDHDSEETDRTENEDETAKTAAYLNDLGMEEEYYDHAYEGPGSSTLYLCQDMRELELYGTIGACVCCCNSINYIMEEEDLKKVFSLVNNYLYPHGLFIFDVNSPFKYETLLADHTIAETRPEGSFIWDNYYDKESRINEYDLTLFIREDLLMEEDSREDEEPEEWEESDAEFYGDRSRGLTAETTGPGSIPYYRFQETHFQKCYSLAAIRRLLEEAGMEFVAAYDNYTAKPATDRSEIITVVAREKGKS